MLWRSAFILLLTHLATSTPLSRRWTDFAEKHSWVEIPQGWELHSEAPSDYSFDLRIGLKQSKMDELIANLMEISDPTHTRYGQHLSKEETDEFVRPHPKSTEAVEEWLEAHGITSDDIIHRTGGGDWITVRVPVAQAERMLGTKYNVFHHPQSGDKVVRTMAYSLPRELHPHIGVVAPTTYFGTMKSMRATSFLQPEIKPLNSDSDIKFEGNAAVPASCATTITPACLRGLYNTSA